MAVARFIELAPKKFDDGAREHGGDLMDVDFLSEIEEELLDAWILLQAMREKLRRLGHTDVADRPQFPPASAD